MAYRQIQYILKRLALGIPALLIITSIVFLLSKTMPGNAGIHLLEQDGGMGLWADGDTREKVYRAYLERTGQEKPLFYFSLSSGAEPDSLNKILPDKKRYFLRQLCFEYGDWQYVNGYYQALKKLRHEMDSHGGSQAHQPIVERLFHAIEEAGIRKELHHLSFIVEENGDDLIAFGDLVQASFEQMLENRKPYRKLIPIVHWNGKDNQYHGWLSGLLRGDMGASLKGQRPVSTVIGEAIGVTLLMSITALCIGWALALALGLLVNLPTFQKPGKPLMTGLYILDTVPLFLLSFFLLIIFSAASYQGVLPAFRMEDYANNSGGFIRVGSLINQLVLPIACMTFSVLPYITAQVDRAIKEELKGEHVKTAYAKGLSDFVVLRKHVLNNAWIPLITLFTNNLPALISGAVVVEVIFAVPGMGRLLVDAVSGRDFPVILGVIIIVATVKVLANILADIFYAFADPRIKIEK